MYYHYTIAATLQHLLNIGRSRNRQTEQTILVFLIRFSHGVALWFRIKTHQYVTKMVVQQRKRQKRLTCHEQESNLRYPDHNRMYYHYTIAATVQFVPYSVVRQTCLLLSTFTLRSIDCFNRQRCNFYT